ncbi:MAG TPA: hypothetical protein VLQ67_14250 [Arachnia sp.]|nr:hypothetical protein [Arachnia sp.]
MHTHQIAVVGTPTATRPLEAALRRAQLRSIPVEPAAALRSPGLISGCALAVFCSQPGTQPTLEAEVYAAKVGALHVAWDASAALVGPFVAPGHGPCPSCLAQASSPAGGGTHRALVSWASALAALQVRDVLRGSTDLVGVGWAWRLEHPGLSLTSWTKQAGCRTAGCAQP